MLSVFVKRNTLAAFLILTCIVGIKGHGEVLLGIGGGVQSYPKDLDPYGFAGSLPVIYPLGEMHFMVTDRISSGCVLSRTIVHGSLEGYVDTYQYLELYSLGFYGEFDFTPGKGFFGFGVQGQSAMGAYCVGEEGNFGNGIGLKLYGVARQRLFSSLLWGMRTGVQRIWIQPPTRNSKLQLDSFNIEILFYLQL